MPAQAAPQPLESPAVRRSRYLSELLTQTRQAPPQIQSGGELAARLLAQGIAQFGANRADKAVQEEATARTRSQGDAASAALARLLGGEPPPITPQAPPPSIAPEGPGNTLTPVQSPTAPIAPIQGAELAPVGQMPAPAPQAPTQAAPAPRNPLGPTPGEAAIIQRQLASGDPAMIAEAQAAIAEIEQRMAAPPDYELRNVNGVEFMIDPRTGQRRQVFDEGVPEVARRDVVTLGSNNPYGLPEGTGITISPDGTVTTVGTPQQGYVRRNGRLEAEEGGSADPSAGQSQITNERELRADFVRQTADYRTVQEAARKVDVSLAQGTGIGDIGGIFAVMKIFDPTSTVREGEFSTAQNSSGVPDYIRNMYNKAVNGERLTPEQRADFANIAHAQAQSYEESYNQRVDDFTRMAGQYGLTAENVVGSNPRPRPRPQAAAPAPAARPAQAAPPRTAPRPNGVTRRWNPNTGRIE